jgi:hypothetical protein
MIKYLRRIFLNRSTDKKFIEHLIELQKQTPNNYQFGCLVKEKIKDYKSGRIKFEKNHKEFSH